MNGQTEKEKQIHEIRIGQRRQMSVTGVREVVSFDEESVVLRSACGEMTVEGKELHVGVLDTDRGVVTLEGKIDGVYYSEDGTQEKRGFFGKLFR